MTDLTLTVSRTIAAPPKAVFEAWLDPAMFARIMRPKPTTRAVTAKLDPVEGGRFELVMKAEESDIPIAGSYLEITRHARLRFTWESAFSGDGSHVTLEFAPEGRGTLVTLNHVKFQNEESRDGHKAGWTAILGELESCAIGQAA